MVLTRRFQVALPLLLPVLSLRAGDPVGPTWRQSIDQGRDRLADALGGLQLSAFGDLLADTAEDGHRRVASDAFELDLSGELTDTLEVAAAGVKDRDATHLASGFLDYHPFGGTIAPRGKLWVEKGFHIQVGRFDVPFGNDWEYYASKDSISISRPLTTDQVMDGGYNDVGMRVLGNNGTVNFNAYLLRGFQPGRLVGGRIGFTPFGDPFSLKGAREQKLAELGYSAYYDATSDWRKREAGQAEDLEVHVGAFTVRTEYLARATWPEAGAPERRHGWHLTQELGLGPATAFARYERVALLAGDASGRETRIAAGFSAT
ncbi:MAG TPA: hypothetical protein VF768_04620, partial [Holophagaceae bacterium]